MIAKTPSPEHLIQEFAKGATITELAKRYNVWVQAIYYKLTKHPDYRQTLYKSINIRISRLAKATETKQPLEIARARKLLRREEYRRHLLFPELHPWPYRERKVRKSKKKTAIAIHRVASMQSE